MSSKLSQLTDAGSLTGTELVYISKGGISRKTTAQTLANLGGGGGGSTIIVKDEGSTLSTNATTLDFVGSGVTATGTGATKTITIAGGGGTALTVQNEGTPLATDASTLNFVGAGVDATGTGATKTITISGGGGSVTGMAVVADRTALAAVTGQVAGDARYLRETGREGVFVWDTSNLSAKVTIDVYQGIYVPPASATTGASGAWVRRYTGPVDLSWFGVLGDGSSILPARVTSAIALTTNNRGDEFRLPQGRVVFSGRVDIIRPIILRGHGAGVGIGGTGNAGTTVEFPAGSSGFRFLYDGTTTGARRAGIRDMYLYQPSRNDTTGTASYNPATPWTVTVSAGSANFANGQTVRLEGMGPSVALPGRTGATTNGSNIVTITNAVDTVTGLTLGLGNPGVHIGQHITVAGAGLPANTTVTAWDSGNITLSNNATITVSGAVVTVKDTEFFTINSGGGTGTLSIDVGPDNTQTVSGAVLRHADCGIESQNPIIIENVDSGGWKGACIYLRGDAVDDLPAGHNVNCSQIKFCKCFTAFVGIVLSGADGNACAVWGCDLSPGLEYGALDLSLIGNDFFGCHFAFNCGIKVSLPNAYTRLNAGYFEVGTSYIAPEGGTSSFWGTTSMANGSGFIGGEQMGGGTRFPALDVTSNLRVGRTATFKDGFLLNGNRRARFEGSTGSDPTGAGGLAVTIGQDGTRGVVQADNVAAYQPFRIVGTTIDIRPNDNAAQMFTFDSAGMKLNGTLLITTRKTGWAAATGTATRTTYATGSVTLPQLAERVKALTDDLIAHGLIGA